MRLTENVVLATEDLIFPLVMLHTPLLAVVQDRAGPPTVKLPVTKALDAVNRPAFREGPWV